MRQTQAGVAPPAGRGLRAGALVNEYAFIILFLALQSLSGDLSGTATAWLPLLIPTRPRRALGAGDHNQHSTAGLQQRVGQSGAGPLPQPRHLPSQQDRQPAVKGSQPPVQEREGFIYYLPTFGGLIHERQTPPAPTSQEDCYE